MGCRFVVGKAETRRFTSLALILASPSSMILVGGDCSEDVAQVMEALGTAQTLEKFSWKWVDTPWWEVMHAVWNRCCSRGVPEVTKIQEERLAHGGGSLKLLLAVCVRFSHCLHHLRLSVERLESSIGARKNICPLKDCRLGRATTCAFA